VTGQYLEWRCLATHIVMADRTGMSMIGESCVKLACEFTVSMPLCIHGEEVYRLLLHTVELDGDLRENNDTF
jgi:hypothetical protein